MQKPLIRFISQHRIHIVYLEDGVQRQMVTHAFSVYHALQGVEQEGVEVQSVADLDATPIDEGKLEEISKS